MTEKYYVIPTRMLTLGSCVWIGDSEERARKEAFDYFEPATVLKYVTDIVHFVEKKENTNDQF